jgi:hypothetical protein
MQIILTNISYIRTFFKVGFIQDFVLLVLDRFTNFHLPDFELTVTVFYLYLKGDRHGSDRIVVGFITTYAISGYHH